MKTTKMIIGIVSIVLSIFITFQSCSVGLVNAVESNTEDLSSSGGFFVAVIFLIAGIVGIAARKSKGGSITAGVFYLLGSLIGFVSLGTFGDLVVWSWLALIFGVVFIAGTIWEGKKAKGSV